MVQLTLNIEEILCLCLRHITYVHKHLNEVKIAGFRGTSNQIDFVIFLLKHAIVLRKLVIDLVCFVGKTKALNKGERERVYEQLQEYSKDAELIIHRSRKMVFIIP